MIVFLSKIILDIRHPSARQAVRDANDMHRNLMAGFSMCASDRCPRADKRILYRVFSRRDRVYLLVSSEERPNVDELARRGFYTEDALIRDISGLRRSFRTGQYLRFELLASPCKKISGEGKNSRRVFLKTEAERENWIRRRGMEGGFRVVQVEEFGGRIDILGKRDSMNVRNAGVLFSGILQIMDAEKFWHCFITGIGPAKAYGMGMLNVANV